MILVIDNMDSFVHNLARYLRLASKDTVQVVSNTLSLAELIALSPSVLVISPGPCAPQQAGVSLSAIRYFLDKIPILGVCLGHQALAEALGGKIVRAKRPLHGQSSAIFHKGTSLFQGLPSPCEVGRYHALIVEEASLPAELVVTAYSLEEEVMAFQHKTYPAFGVQFHPESILTPDGMQMIAQFLIMSRRF